MQQLSSSSSLKMGRGSPRDMSPIRSASPGRSRPSSPSHGSPTSVYSASAMSPRSAAPARKRSSMLGAASWAHTPAPAVPATPASAPASDFMDYDQVWKSIPPQKVLFLNDAHGSMSQALLCELQSCGHEVFVHIVDKSKGRDAASKYMLDVYELHKPDLVMCPFLTAFVPEELYNMSVVAVFHPGPAGDKGSNSVDHAVRNKCPEWGLTVLQAASGVDDGPVYAHRTFEILEGTCKSELYGIYGVQAATSAMRELMVKVYFGVQPKDVGGPDVVPGLTYEQRRVDFTTMNAEQAAKCIQVSDSRPGAPGVLHDVDAEFRFFNARVESAGTAADKAAAAAPGEVLGHRDGAILVRCADASCVWVGMLQFVPEAYRGATKAGRMRCIPTVKDEQPSDAVKMFASAELLKRSPWINLPLLPGPSKAERLPFGTVPATWQQVWVTGDGGEAYVHWSYYNGAMATEHCEELREVLAELAAQPDIKVITLVGDRKVFSNGIHLNPLAAMLIDGNSDSMAEEGWANINAIDNVIKEIFKMTDKAVVSAVWGNAGAGGAIVPLAGDIVWAHAGAVFNASYDNMGLFGSEYWTYLLPMRVGDQLAAALTTECQPINANQAKSIKFVDDVIACKHDDFPNEVRARVQALAASGKLDCIVDRKRQQRTQKWWEGVESKRAAELVHMKQNFASERFATKLINFVCKLGGGGEVNVKTAVPPISIGGDNVTNNVRDADGLFEEATEVVADKPKMTSEDIVKMSEMAIN